MSDITIDYKGSTIATINSSGTTTLGTSGKWCEDDITLTYVRPDGGSSSYIGTNPVKIADYAAQTVALSSTSFATWTPSTTATDIYASSNSGTVALDLSTYNYEILWFFDSKLVYDGTESGARIVRQCQCVRQSIYKSPNGITKLSSKNYNNNLCTTLFTAGLIDYYTASNARALAYTIGAGIYPSATAATFSSNTSDSPTMTIKTPKVRAQCNATLLTTTNCAKVNKTSSEFAIRGELWRIDKDSAMQGMYRNIVELYNT